MLRNLLKMPFGSTRSILFGQQKMSFQTLSEEPYAKHIAYQIKINQLPCKESKKTAFKLMEEYKLTSKEAFEEIRGLEIDSETPFNNINIQILNGLAHGFKRRDIDTLLGGSIEELENATYAKELFIAKLNFIIKTGDSDLFSALKNMTPFTPIHETAIETIAQNRKCSYLDAALYVKEYDQDDIAYIATQKFREAAGDVLHLNMPLEVGHWFNSDKYVNALDILVNQKKMNIDEALQQLKSIRNERELDSILSSRKHEESYSPKLK